MATWIFADPLTAIALACAVVAALLLIYYLIKRPPLHTPTKLLLLAGLGVFPILAAGSGNYAGFEQTTKREFCNGCHVMEPWVNDAEDRASTSLASMHTRNELFGDRSCYTCHADYGMYGTVATKLNGLHHVAAYIRTYRDVPVERALATIRPYRAYPNRNCTHCHSATLPGFAAIPDHRSLGQPGRADPSCVSGGCHGPAHPFAAAAQAAAPEAR